MYSRTHADRVANMDPKYILEYRNRLPDDIRPEYGFKTVEEEFLPGTFLCEKQQEKRIVPFCMMYQHDLPSGHGAVLEDLSEVDVTMPFINAFARKVPELDPAGKNMELLRYIWSTRTHFEQKE